MQTCNYFCTSLYFIGSNDAKAETPVLWPPRAKRWLIGKDSDAGRDSGQEEKGTTEDEVAGWHHRFNGREFEWTPGDGDRQGGLASCNSWGPKSQTRLSDWTELNIYFNINTYIRKDKEAWRAAVHGVAKSWTQLRDWTTNYWLYFW